MSCKAVQTEGTDWNFCPSLGASAFFIVLFGATTLFHLYQAIHYRKAYCWVIIMSGIWQTITYIFRTISIANPAATGTYIAWFTLILFAPLWTNAFIYMVFGRMVWNFVEVRRVWSFKAWHFGLSFVLLDILAFVIQAYGAASAAGDVPIDQVLKGLHIYMGGVALQLFFILLFSVFAVKLFFMLRARSPSDHFDASAAIKLLAVLFIALALICLRIIFRLIEYSSGLDSSIPNHEAYQYTLDSLPMLVAIAIFHWVHPGQVMPGKQSDMPSMWKQIKNRKNYETPFGTRSNAQ